MNSTVTAELVASHRADLYAEAAYVRRSDEARRTAARLRVHLRRPAHRTAA